MVTAVLRISNSVLLTVLRGSRVVLVKELDINNPLEETLKVLKPLDVQTLKVLMTPTILHKQCSSEILTQVININGQQRYIHLSAKDVDKLRELSVMCGIDKLEIYDTITIAKNYGRRENCLVCLEATGSSYTLAAIKDNAVADLVYSFGLNISTISSLMKIHGLDKVYSIYNKELIGHLIESYSNIKHLTLDTQYLLVPSLISFEVQPNIYFDFSEDDEDEGVGLTSELAAQLFQGLEQPVDEQTDDADELEEYLPEDEEEVDEEPEDEFGQELAEEINDDDDLHQDDDEPIDEPITKEDDFVGRPKRNKSKLGKVLLAVGIVVGAGLGVSVGANMALPAQINNMNAKVSQINTIVGPLESTASYYTNYLTGLKHGKNIDTPVLEKLSKLKVKGVILESGIDNNNVNVNLWLQNPKDIESVQKELNTIFIVESVQRGQTKTEGKATLTNFVVKGILPV